MSDNSKRTSGPVDSQDWQMWLVLRHLLPGRLQRAVIHETISSMTKGKVELSDLFEEIRVDGPIWNESWIVRPRSVASSSAGRLQTWVQCILWQNDEVGILHESGASGQNGTSIGAELLDFLIRLSVADFNHPDIAGLAAELDARFDRDLHESVRRFLSAFKIAQRDICLQPEECWQRISEPIEDIGLPLRCMLTKHIADLFADADRWPHSVVGYAKVQSMLQAWVPAADEEDVANAWKAIVRQSQACATSIISSQIAAASSYLPSLTKTPLASDPISAINAGLDAANVQPWLDDRGFMDTRVAVLSAPLLAESHTIEGALSYWLNGKHADANRRFWAVLRRHAALGSSVRMKSVKGWYGRSLIDQIDSELGKTEMKGAFELAVNLFIESERPENVGFVKWTQSLVDAYVVSQELLDRIADHAAAHDGVRIQRTGVLVELFKAWAVVLTPSRHSLVVSMWTHLARVAHMFEATFEARTDLGRRALTALQELGRKRPEVRVAVVNEVGDAICQKLGEKFRWGQVEAINTALIYADAFDDRTVHSIVSRVLSVLDEQDPRNTFAPLTRAALRFLVEGEIRNRLRNDDELSKRCLDQIFRFGLEEEVSPMMLFFHLADFDERLLDDPTVQDRVRGPLERVRRAAHELNSSNVTGCIEALLVAPVISGYEGVRDALDSLQAVFASASSDSVSLGLPHLSNPLLLLTEKIPMIRAVLRLREDWLASRLSALAGELVKVWEIASDRPLLFAELAFPPRTKPNDVLVHNSAFASLRFGKAIGQEAAIQKALNRAAGNRELAAGIALARATLATGLESSRDEGPDLAEEDRHSFYQSLGRRLVQLHYLLVGDALDDARVLGQKLLKGCVLFGPHASDAAVLITAMKLGLQQYAKDNGIEAYVARTKEDKENRLLLLPIAEHLFRHDGPNT